MTTLHHPKGVIVHGRLFSDYPAATHISPREWLALGVLLVGLLLWIAGTVGGVVWVISEVVSRWR